MNRRRLDPSSTSSFSPPPEPIVRLRSVPYKSPYVWAQIFAFFNYCAAVAILTTLPLFFLYPKSDSVRVLIASVVLYALTGLVSFLKRRHVLCPLCKGTPLVSSRAHVHPKATRIFPLDYGTSSMLILIFTQTFRCMFCGAHFDLLKPRPDTKTLKEPVQDNLS